jgi:hypothetical protein
MYNQAGLALICANRFISFLKKSKNQNLLNTIIHNDIHLNLIFDYGQFITGYIGNSFKLDEIFISECITRCDRFLKTIKYEMPSILLLEDYYEVLDEKVKRLFYPCHLIHWRQKIFYLYRQYIDYKQFHKTGCNEEIILKKILKFKNSKILKHRNRVNKLFKYCNKDMTDMIIDSKYFIFNVERNVPHKVLEKISLIYDHILSCNYDTVSELYMKVQKFSEDKIIDEMLKRQIRQLESTIALIRRERINHTLVIK